MPDVCGSDRESSGHPCVRREWDVAPTASSSGPCQDAPEPPSGRPSGLRDSQGAGGLGNSSEAFLQKGHGVIPVVLSLVMPVVTGPGPSHTLLFGSYTVTRDMRMVLEQCLAHTSILYESYYYYIFLNKSPGSSPLLQKQHL